jgi:branched-chain amino acid transport system substrate-binding protein
MHRKLLLISILLIAGLALAGCAAEEPFVCEDELGCVTYAPDDPIRIATALVISGPNTDLGMDSQRGVEIAAELRGEVAGHAVELQHEDEQCNAEGGQAAGQKIVSDPTIIGAIGTSCSGAGVPMSEVISEAGYFMISPSNTSPFLTDPSVSWNAGYYRTAHNDLVQGAAAADFAFNTLGLASAAAIHDGDPYTIGLTGAFTTSYETLGGDIVAYEGVSKEDVDMRPVLTTVSAAGPPEFLYFPIFTQGCGFIANQAREVAGLEDTVLSAADGCISPAAVEAMGEAGEGVYFSGPDLTTFGGETYDTFLSTHSEMFGIEPTSVFHAHSFDAFNMIADCIEEVGMLEDDGTLHIGRQDMRTCLTNISGFSGITGSLTCDQYGDCADPKISVSELQDGEYVKIWP